MFAYCENDPVNKADRDGNKADWVTKVLVVTTVAALVVAGTIATVATFGAGSVVGFSAITAAATFAARVTEVSSLQYRKSRSEGTGHDNAVANCFEAVYDNAKKVIGITPYTKSAAVSANISWSYSKATLLNRSWSIKGALGATASKWIGGFFAVYAWTRTIVSVFSKDPTARANQRGYVLK